MPPVLTALTSSFAVDAELDAGRYSEGAKRPENQNS